MKFLYKYLILLYCLSFCNISKGQDSLHINGTVIDGETELPISNAVIISSNTNNTITDTNGHFSLLLADNERKIKVTLLGYKEQYCEIDPYKSNYIIKLSRKYLSLTSFEIKATKIDIDSLIKGAINNIHTNYTSAQTALKANYYTTLSNEADTIIDANRTIYMQNSKEKWFDYKFYENPNDSFTIIKNKLTETILKNYMPIVITTFQSDYKKALTNYMWLKNTNKVVLSTFFSSGDKYYDIIFIDSNTKIKYSLLAKAFGFGGKNNPNSGKVYISLRELQINSKTLAVYLFRILTIESSNVERQVFLKLSNKNGIENWINKAISLDNRFCLDKTIFKPDNNGILTIKRETYFDDLMHPAFRGTIPENYKYFCDYNIIETIKSLPEKLIRFDPNLDLDVIRKS